MIIVELPENYRNLINAIVIRAVKDYRRALRRLRRDPRHEPSKYRKREIECFFRSQWFADLYGISGEMMIQELKKEVM
jgi:hypothetical protein